MQLETLLKAWRKDEIGFTEIIKLLQDNEDEPANPTPEDLSRILVVQYFKMVDEYHENTDAMSILEWQDWVDDQALLDMESWWIPVHWHYEEVLKSLSPDDVVFDVGAGNFALDILMAGKCQKVYAVEVNPTVVNAGLEIIGYYLPKNLICICGNALNIPVPSDVNTLVMLLKNWKHSLPDKWTTLPKVIWNLGGEFSCTKSNERGI